MPHEIRAIRADELEQYVRLDAYAFGYAYTPEVVERYRTYTKPEWTLGAYEDGRLVAQLIAYPWQMAINGGRVALGGIADVAAWPEDRRSGHVAALLSACLGRMRDQGQALSMLNPTFYTLYQRFGWAQAAETRNYTLRPADLRFLPSLPAPRGRAERLDPGAALPALATVYDESLATANGALVRDQAHWLWRTLRARSGPPLQAILWREAGDAPTGYLLHRAPLRAPSHAAVVDQDLQVTELVALTADAYRGLVRYLAHHDLVDMLRWTAPPDDPLPSMLADPIAPKIDTWPGFMLRVVDLVPALESRAYLPGPPAQMVLRVADAAAPWNQGTWLVEVEAGKGRVRVTAREPDISLAAGTLAALFNGFLSPARALRAGLLETQDERALTTAVRIFAVSHPPFCPDNF